MQYKYCVNCEHFNIGRSVMCSLAFKQIARTGDFANRGNEYRIAEITVDDDFNVAITKNPNFTMPQNCPYKLEHIIS